MRSSPPFVAVVRRRRRSACLGLSAALAAATTAAAGRASAFVVPPAAGFLGSLPPSGRWAAPPHPSPSPLRGRKGFVPDAGCRRASSLCWNVAAAAAAAARGSADGDEPAGVSEPSETRAATETTVVGAAEAEPLKAGAAASKAEPTEVKGGDETVDHPAEVGARAGVAEALGAKPQKTVADPKGGAGKAQNRVKAKGGKRAPRKAMRAYSAKIIDDNGLNIVTDEEGRVTARPAATVAEAEAEAGVELLVDAEVEVVVKSKATAESFDSEPIEGVGPAVGTASPDAGRSNVDMASVANEKAAGAAANASTVAEIKITRSDAEAGTKSSIVEGGGAEVQTKPADEMIAAPRTKTIIPEVLTSKPRPADAASAAESAKSARRASPKRREKRPMQEHPAPKLVPTTGFNVVLTHCTADFDSLASAVGLAKLWSSERPPDEDECVATLDGGELKEDCGEDGSAYRSADSSLPTFVVLPRGAHPSVQRFLALHKHLFPIRSLRSLPEDLSGLNRLGLVDAQRRDRVGPAEHLLGWASRVTIVDHHIDGESDIPEATDYVVDRVGSVSTMVAERLRDAGVEVTEAEATLLALGIHADTGSLCFDSTTARDAEALAWVMAQGASQAAIAEHAQASLSPEQQGVLTQALLNANSTVVHGVTLSTVLLSAEGFINGLAAVAQDALELSSSDAFLLAVVYEAKSGGRRKGKGGKRGGGEHLQARLLEEKKEPEHEAPSYITFTEAWKGGEEAMKRRRLRAAFDRKDADGSGYLCRDEIAATLSSSGIIATSDAVTQLMDVMDSDGDGRIDFEEFVTFSNMVEERQKEQDRLTGRRASTMIIIGRIRAGVNTRALNLNQLFQRFGGGGHAKAASATVRLEDEGEAGKIMQGLVDEIVETGLAKQPTVGDFMTAPVLSARPTMTERQVEDLFTRYDVRALPVVDDDNNVIGLVTYKEVAAAKQRLWNKEQKRLRREVKEAASAKASAGSKEGDKSGDTPAKYAEQKKRGEKVAKDRKLGSALKGWMKQHVRIVEASMTMAEVEAVLLENDVGCIPVVADGTKQLVGMVTRTDLLRQHRYYPTLYYHNKGFSDSIAKRKPIIELRKRLKKFDMEDE